jgi:hypothetical protein
VSLAALTLCLLMCPGSATLGRAYDAVDLMIEGGTVVTVDAERHVIERSPSGAT